MHTSRSLVIAVGAAVCAVLLAVAALVLPQSPFGLGDGGTLAIAGPRTVKIAEASPLILELPVEVSSQNIEQNVTVDPPLTGEITVQGTKLAFHPSAPLALGESYTLHVSPKTQRSDGSPLGRELKTTYLVAGPPIVTMQLPPANQDEVPVDIPLSLFFDRPMRALGGNEEDTTIPATIDPPTAGNWQWESSSVLRFIPKGNWKPATQYTVSIQGSELKSSLTADPLKEDLRWTFSTQRPNVLGETEPNYGLIGRKQAIIVRFQLPVQLESVKQKAHLKDAKSGQAFPITVSYHVTKTETGSTTDESAVDITPQQQLPMSTQVELQVEAGVAAKGGNLTSSNELKTGFMVAGPMEAKSVRQEYGAIIFSFTNPASALSLSGAIRVSPAIPDWNDSLANLGEYTNQDMAIYPPSILPGTAYTFTVTTNVKDAWGTPMSKEQTFTLKTADLEPEIAVHNNGDFGVFEASKPPVLYFNALNVKTLQVELAKVSLQEFQSMRVSREQNWNYAPSLQGYEGARQWSLPATAGRNLWKTIPFDLGKQLGTNVTPGLYVLTLTSPEAVQSWSNGQQQHLVQFLSITDTALTLKISGNRALTWAVDMQTGKPATGAHMQLLKDDGTVMAEGAANSDGMFDAPISLKDFSSYMPTVTAVATRGADTAFVTSTWVSGMSPYDFGLSEDFAYDGLTLQKMEQIVTDRPLYRAGDTVGLKSIVRIHDADGRLTIPGGDRQLHVMVDDPEGTRVFEKTLPFSAFGTVAWSVPLDAKAKLGTYSVSTNLVPETDMRQSYFGSSFQVLAYRRPDYRVEVEPKHEDVVFGDTATATIRGSYYFGAPMAGAKVQWRAITQNYYFNRADDSSYSFSEESVWCWGNCDTQNEMIASGEGVLNDRGELEVQVPLQLQSKKLSQVLSIEADVSDLNNQVVSGRAGIRVHQADVYVGLKMENYVVAPGEKAQVNIATVTTAGDALPGTAVHLQLAERTWTTVKKKGVDAQYYYESTFNDKPIEERDVRTGNDGLLKTAFTVPRGGSFVILATARDAGGRMTRSSTSVYAWSDTYVNWPRANGNRITVTTDKRTYKVGDTAHLLIQSPFQGKGVSALLTIERESIIQKKLMPIKSSAQQLDIPITADLAPNAYVSIVILKPRVGETFDDQGLDTGVPAFRIGYASLKIDTAQKELSVSIHTDKERYKPGDTVTVDVDARDFQGKPVTAELTLAAVDMSVLDLAGFQTPNPMETFYGLRGLGVRTAQSLVFLLERFKPGSKGGGGGDEEGNVRGEFKDTAYWNPSVITDAQGHARIAFRLPDNLTTWKFVAVGITKDSLVGASTHEVLETKPVIVRSVRPRFAVPGDSANLAAIVRNGTTNEAIFTVSLSGSGLRITGKAEQTVKVPADGQAKVQFPVIFSDAASATMQFAAKAAAGSDAIRETIPLQPFGITHVTAAAGVVENGGVTEELFVPGRDEATSAAAELTVAPSMASYLPGSLDYLVHYPYGCAEQTASAVIPNLAVSRLQQATILQIGSKQQVDDNVVTGLERLLTFQRGDGGFGFWQDSTKSNPSLTAYILEALLRAKDAGFAVDGSVVARTKQYLQDVLRQQDLSSDVTLAERVNILLMLGKAGSPDSALLSNAYEQRNRLPLYAKAQLAMALTEAADQRRGRDVLQEIATLAKVDPRGAHFEEKDISGLWRWHMNTDARTTALVAQAMVEVQPDHPLLFQTMRGLLQMRTGNHWDTTQSTAQAIFALVSYIDLQEKSPVKATASIQLDQKEVAQILVDAGKSLAAQSVDLALTPGNQGAFHTVDIALGGGARAYYDLVSTTNLKATQIEAADEGMRITRTVTPVRGSPATPTVGGTYKVHLTIVIPEERHFVAVRSPHPAGFEGIDFALQTSQQSLQGELEQGPSENWWWSPWVFTHTEYRDDEFFLFGEHVPAGVYEQEYLVRATLPGTFKWRPARVEEMYYPELYGTTEGGPLTVKDAAQ